MTEDIKIVLYPDPILKKIMADTPFDETTDTIKELEKCVEIRLASDRHNENKTHRQNQIEA